MDSRVGHGLSQGPDLQTDCILPALRAGAGDLGDKQNLEPYIAMGSTGRWDGVTLDQLW